MSMHHQESIAVMAGEGLVFEPGGLNVTLIGLTRELGAGVTFEAAFVFEPDGEISVPVTVRDDPNDN